MQNDGYNFSQFNSQQANNLSLGIKAIDDVNDSISTYPKCSDINITTSTLIKTGAGNVYGIVIGSHTSGTIKLWDNTSATGTVIVNTMTLAVGERFIPLLGASFTTGLFVTIAGTADITILFR